MRHPEVIEADFQLKLNSAIDEFIGAKASDEVIKDMQAKMNRACQEFYDSLSDEEIVRYKIRYPIVKVRVTGHKIIVEQVENV